MDNELAGDLMQAEIFIRVQRGLSSLKKAENTDVVCKAAMDAILA